MGEVQTVTRAVQEQSHGGLKKFSKFLQGPLHWRMGFHLTNLILIAGGLFNRFHPNEVENARVGCEFTAPTSLCWSPTASMPSAMDWGDISRVGGVSPKTEASSTGGKGSALPCTVCEHSQSLTWSTSSVKGKFAVGCSIIDRDCTFQVQSVETPGLQPGECVSWQRW